MRGRPTLAALSVLAVLAVIAAAPARAEDPDFLAVQAGVFDVVLDEDRVGAFALEYRSSFKAWIFKPFIGIMTTTDEAVYGYGGILVDVFLGHRRQRWVITPSVAVGGYTRGGGKDLGAVPEFRTGLEIAYRFDDRSRLGLMFHHISNADIGDRNPGTETLVLSYSVPIRNLFGR
jgi:hypothetical protein